MPVSAAVPGKSTWRVALGEPRLETAARQTLCDCRGVAGPTADISLAATTGPVVGRVSACPGQQFDAFLERCKSLPLSNAAVLEGKNLWVGRSSMPEQCAAMNAKELSNTELISLDAGEFLFREGETADALYIVKKGTLRVVSGSTVYETIKAGGIVGEMAIVDQQSRRSASVIAGTHAELWMIDRKQFLDLVAHNPDFSIEVMQVMARRLRVMNRRYRSDRT